MQLELSFDDMPDMTVLENDVIRDRFTDISLGLIVKELRKTFNAIPNRNGFKFYKNGTFIDIETRGQHKLLDDENHNTSEQVKDLDRILTILTNRLSELTGRPFIKGRPSRSQSKYLFFQPENSKMYLGYSAAVNKRGFRGGTVYIPYDNS